MHGLKEVKILKRHGNLYPEIVSFQNLLLASKAAFRGKKSKPRVAEFYFDLENELLALQEELVKRTYQPRPLHIFKIREPKEREIGASDFRDRVVHHAVCRVAGPVLEKSFIHRSYACRVGKGTHRSIRQAQEFTSKKKYFLKCDIRKFFESIDHNILKDILARKFKDPDLLWLLHTIIDSSQCSFLGKGIPIGNLTSQYFANLYLDRLDHYVKESLRVKCYLRYMDDFLLFSNDKKELHIFHSGIMAFLRQELKLELKEEITIIAPVSEGIPFLGCRIFPNLIRIKGENKHRSLKKLKGRRHEFLLGKITEEQYSQSLMSVTEHLKIGNTFSLRKDIFSRMFF